MDEFPLVIPEQPQDKAMVVINPVIKSAGRMRKLDFRRKVAWPNPWSGDPSLMLQAAPESTRGVEYACLGLENTVWEANLSTGIDPVRGLLRRIKGRVFGSVP